MDLEVNPVQQSLFYEIKWNFDEAGCSFLSFSKCRYYVLIFYEKSVPVNIQNSS